MLDGRGQSDRDNEQNRLPVEFRCSEVRQGQPGGVSDFFGIDHTKVERQREAHQHAGDDRHQTENAFAEHRHDQRGQQGGHRNQHGGLIRNQLHAIAGLAHRHVGCNRGHGQTVEMLTCL
ncbi:hypothetical protein PSYPI_33323, partial [Pseudomonas syringae pv. pisi str. 1704B]